jgi:hypothetical protein
MVNSRERSELAVGCSHEAPSFFVIGPPRTGTSWLHEVLAKYTLLPAPTKETHFFDVHFHRGWEWYKAHFPKNRDGRRVGEIAPTYFASRLARERIARTLPEARVVCIFRNPVERALSLYRLKRAYAMIPWDLEEALARDPELIESGRYATHLKSWQAALGVDQVLPTLYDDLLTGTQNYLNNLADFIAVPRFALDCPTGRTHGSETLTHPRSYHWTRSATRMAEWFKAHRMDSVVAAVMNLRLAGLFLGGGRCFDEPSARSLSRISYLFRPEIEELEILLNRDLSAWKLWGRPAESVVA